MITAQNKPGSGFEPIAAGAYLARCFSMVHIGTVVEEYMGEQKMMNKVRISFELPTETKVFKEEKGEEPYSIGKEFTLSMHEKATLRKFLESWRGKGFSEEETKEFDISKLLGIPCMINVIHKTSKAGKKYAEIASISPVAKGMDCPPQVNPNFEFSYEPFSEEKYNQLPQWLREKVAMSAEYKAIHQGQISEGVDEKENDLPF